MIPKESKRLAEVYFPIAGASRHAVREKSIWHGHPNTLHLWWARRPLASCRAMSMTRLLPDPCDPQCPEGFKSKARRVLPKAVGNTDPEDSDLRTKLLEFIGNFWARTVRCETPKCGAAIPPMRSFWLGKKPKRKWALKHRRVKRRKGALPRVDFKVFKPKADEKVQTIDATTLDRVHAAMLPTAPR